MPTLSTGEVVAPVGDRRIHFVYSRWAMKTACGITRSSLPVGRAHIAMALSRITCESCRRIVVSY